MTMIKIKISLVNIFANSKLEIPFNCMMVISFDVYSLLREIMIPKKRPRDIINGEEICTNYGDAYEKIVKTVN